MIHVLNIIKEKQNGKWKAFWTNEKLEEGISILLNGKIPSV